MRNGTKMFEIDDELLRKVKVWRFEKGKTDKKGFQRVLREEKVNSILESVKQGKIIPPIMLAKVGKDVICFDGQHRLEARRKKNFPLFAQLSPCTRDEAAANFVTINAKGAKVGLRHRISVDPGRFAKRLRALAIRRGADVTQAYNLLMGVSGTRARREIVSPEEFKVADSILRYWSKDKRWSGNLDRGKRSLYNKPGTLKLIGSICKERPKEISGTVKLLRKVNYNRVSAYGRKFGSGNSDQMSMRDYVMRFLWKKNGNGSA